MIRERPNFMSLTSVDVMEKLNTHEEQEEGKRDLYGSSECKNHALKIVADSSSDGNAEEDSDDPERRSKDLALITKRFQHFHKKSHGRYDLGNYRSKSKSKNYDSDDEKKTKKFFKKKDNSASKSSSRPSSKNPSKSSSNRKNTSRKAKAYIGKEMDSEEEEEFSTSEEENESDEDSDSGMAGIACTSSPAINFLGNPSSDDETPAYCFMSKASKEKVSSKHHKVHSSDQYSSDEDDHAKLIQIANIQQNSLEKIEKTLRKSEGLLVEDMEKNQSLAEESSTLKSRMDELSTRHDFLSTDHERLTYGYLKMKQELEGQREARDDLMRENSLLTQ
nr:microfibrillar-associated protein 1-like [Aegilops tauschii subsp. strangulata]